MHQVGRGRENEKTQATVEQILQQFTRGAMLEDVDKLK